MNWSLYNYSLHIHIYVDVYILFTLFTLIINSYICGTRACACSVASVMSDSLQSYGLQASRLLCPWDSPDKNTRGLPCPPPGDLPNAGIESASLTSPVLAGSFLPLAPPGKPRYDIFIYQVLHVNSI